MIRGRNTRTQYYANAPRGSEAAFRVIGWSRSRAALLAQRVPARLALVIIGNILQ